jgi:dTDP-4-dehydrorhamnose reductase
VAGRKPARIIRRIAGRGRRDETGGFMKILLTGCNGQLGTDIRLVCEGEHDVIAHDLDLDITDRVAVASRVRQVRPDLVFNAAAYTDVDRAESEELTAFRINALGVQNLALACQPAAVPLLHVSTDFVFDGASDRPYTEFDPPRPAGVYGRSKHAGECYLTGLLDRYYLCRTSWLFGTAGRNFVKTILRAAGENEVVRVVNDQEGSPTYSRDLAAKLIEIAQSGAYGVYHVSNAGRCTWYEFTRQIFELAGIETPVEPITTEELSRPAPRPRYSVMRGLALQMQGMEPLRDYREALRQFVLEDLPAWEARGAA